MNKEVLNKEAVMGLKIVFVCPGKGQCLYTMRVSESE